MWEEPRCNPHLFNGLWLTTKFAGKRNSALVAIQSFIRGHITLNEVPSAIPTLCHLLYSYTRKAGCHSPNSALGRVWEGHQQPIFAGLSPGRVHHTLVLNSFLSNKANVDEVQLDSTPVIPGLVMKYSAVARFVKMLLGEPVSKRNIAAMIDPQ
jgi:hypothetical protein